MFIPRKNIGPWAQQIIAECLPDLEERIQRGALYRNLYLTGDENGTPATYPKSFEHIESLGAIFFSSVDLRYLIRFNGGGNPTQRAMGRQAASEIHELLTDAGVYQTIQQTVKWSLVKGKTIFKMNWEEGGYAPYLIQPEFFGVLRPDINDLNRQPAFVHSTYYTPQEFASAFRHLPNLGDIMKKIRKSGMQGKPDNRPDRANALKQVVLGGLNPYQAASGSPTSSSSRGLVNWLGGPQATWDAKVLATLIRLDELWVKDSVTDDWATFQLVGDVVVTGGDIIRNAFADVFDPDNKMRRLPDAFRRNNPLSGMHPFIPFSATELDGYFWGRSEICNIGALQMQINARLNGIMRLLRRQENPPKLYTGGTGINQMKYTAGDKPGAWFTEPSPAAKVQDLYPQLPSGLWESLHEEERMFDEMGGRPPVLKGRGEGGVRSQSHANTLTANASPRFKNSALSIEKSIAEVGHLALAMAKAMDNRTIVAWLHPDTQNIVAQMEPDYPTLEPPAPGMKQYPFQFCHIPANAKVTVDSHSSSPIFSAEARGLIFDLVKIGAMDPAEAVEHLHPAGEEEIIAEIDRREIEKAKLLKEHPELLLHQGGKKGRK